MTLRRALGFTVVSLLMPCLLLGLQAGCTTRPPTASKLQRLQGRWEGVWRIQATPGGPLINEHGDAGNKATFTITGNSLHYLGQNPDQLWEATFTLPAGTNPHLLRTTITGPPDQMSGIGTVVCAIFKIEDGTLTLAMNHLDPEHPPKSFEPPKSSEEHKAMARYELRKVQPQKTDAEASTSK